MEEKEPKLEQQPKAEPIVLTELDKSVDKVDFSKLSEGDQFQVATRYLNDLCAITKSNLQITADLYVLLEFICEKLGIDVRKKKMELARRIKAQQEENIKAAKEELIKASQKRA